MQLAAAQLARHLQGPLRPLYVVHGDEPLLAQEAGDAIRAAARRAGYGERMVFTVAGAQFDWSEILAANASQSLFADRQLIEIRIPGGKPGREGGAALKELAAGAVPDGPVLTLIALPRLDRSTKTGAWFTALEHAGAAIQIDPVAIAALPAWIAARLKQQGQHVAQGEEGQRTLQFFAACVEGNLLAAHQEIQKLALLYPPGELRWEQVEQAVLNVARYDVFSLSETALAGDRARVQRMLDGLQAEGVAPVLVHWVLTEDVRALKHVRDALDAHTPLPLALKRSRIWGTKERLFERILPRLSTPASVRLLRSAHAADRVIKGLPAEGWPNDGWQALERLALQLCAASAPDRALGAAHRTR